MLPARGRPGAALVFDIERELTAEDILRLATTPAAKVGPPILQRLRDKHHAIARHLASGKTVRETAELCGLTPQRVGDLARTDPAFQNLLSYYKDQVTVAGVDEAREFRGKLRGIGREALDEIALRLDNDDMRGEIPTDELRRLAEMSLDRTDAPPRTAQQAPPAPTTITFNMGPRRLEPKTIDNEPPSEAPILELEYDESHANADPTDDKDPANPESPDRKPDPT